MWEKDGFRYYGDVFAKYHEFDLRLPILSHQNGMPGSGFPGEAVAQDGSGDFGQRENFLRGTAKNGFPGHAEDDATGFILGNRERLGLFHFEEAVCPVITHAGHQNAHCAGPGSLRHGTKQHIDAGAMARHQGAVAHLEKIAWAEPTDEGVAIPGSDVGPAGDDLFAVSGFSDFDAANAIEAFGEGRCEAFGPRR